MHIKKMKEKNSLKLFGGNPSQLSLIRHNQVYYTIKLKFFKDYCTDHEIVLYKREFENSVKNNVYYQALNNIFNGLLTEIIKGISRPTNGQAQGQEQKQAQESHTNSTLSRLDFYNSFVCNAINSIDVAKKIREKSNIESIISDNKDDDNKLDKVQGILTAHSANIKNAVNSCKIVINGNDFGGKNCLMYLIIDGSDQNDKKEYTEDDKKLREKLTDSNPFCYLRECSIREYVFYNSIQLFVKNAKNNTYVLVANAPEVKSQNHGDDKIKEAEVNMNQQNQAEQSNAQPVVPQEQPQGQPQEQQQGQQRQQQDEPKEEKEEKEKKLDGEQEEKPKEEKEEKEEKKEGGKGEKNQNGQQPPNTSQSQTGKQKVQQRGNSKSQPKQPNTSQSPKRQQKGQTGQQKGQLSKQNQKNQKPKQSPKKQPNINRNIIFCKEPTKEPEVKEINTAKTAFKKCIEETINKLLEITKSIHINLDDNLRNKLTISLRYLNTNQH